MDGREVSVGPSGFHGVRSLCINGNVRHPAFSYARDALDAAGVARRLGMGAGFRPRGQSRRFAICRRWVGQARRSRRRWTGRVAHTRSLAVGSCRSDANHVYRHLAMRAAFQRGRIVIIGRRHAHRHHVSPCFSRADVVVRVAAGDGTGFADVHVARWLNQRGGSPFAVTVSRKVATVESLWSTLRPVRIGARMRMAERLQRRASIRKGGVSLSHERAKSMRCVRKNAIALGVTPHRLQASHQLNVICARLHACVASRGCRPGKDVGESRPGPRK